MNERLRDMEIGKNYKLELLLEYADRNDFQIISKTISLGTMAMQSGKEVRINDISAMAYIIHNNNEQSISNTIFAEYI